MRSEAILEIGARLQPGARVLDVGGAANVFKHATHVLDILPLEVAQRIWALRRQGSPEIRPENWVVHDICDRQPFPFPDKHFDFVVCSHTLEDIRDPLHVCAEMSRVARAGYIETPSPVVELTRGMDPWGRSWVGHYHHRWIVSVENGGLVFLFKPHFIHGSRRFSFPPRYVGQWRSSGRLYTSLFWEGSVKAVEKVLVVREDVEREIERMILEVRGETWSMKSAHVRQALWNTVAAWADRLGIRGGLGRFLTRRMRRRYS